MLHRPGRHVLRRVPGVRDALDRLNLRDVGMLDQRLSHGLAPPVDELHDLGRKARLEQDLDERPNRAIAPTVTTGASHWASSSGYSGGCEAVARRSMRA